VLASSPTITTPTLSGNTNVTGLVNIGTANQNYLEIGGSNGSGGIVGVVVESSNSAADLQLAAKGLGVIGFGEASAGSGVLIDNTNSAYGVYSNVLTLGGGQEGGALAVISTSGGNNSTNLPLQVATQGNAGIFFNTDVQPGGPSFGSFIMVPGTTYSTGTVSITTGTTTVTGVGTAWESNVATGDATYGPQITFNDGLTWWTIETVNSDTLSRSPTTIRAPR
jgi:hypothetical protein